MWREKMIHSTLLKLQMPFEAARGVIDSGFLTENERTGSGSSRESSAVKIPTFEDVHLGKNWGKKSEGIHFQTQ